MINDNFLIKGKAKRGVKLQGELIAVFDTKGDAVDFIGAMLKNQSHRGFKIEDFELCYVESLKKDTEPTKEK